MRPVFERLLDGWKRQGYALVSTRTMFETLDLAALPLHEVAMGSITGRSGTLAVPGARIAA